MKKRAWIEISLKNIAANLKKIKQYTGKKVIACVKASCYGLGARRIAPYIEKFTDWLAVATVNEGIELREAGLVKPILVLGPVLPEEVVPAVRHNLTLTIFSRPILKEIAWCVNHFQKEVSVQVKVDTGMGRIGLRPAQTARFLREVKEIKGVKLEGIFTHLATAENPDRTYAHFQLGLFRQVLQDPLASSLALKHVANSAAVLNLPESWKPFDMVRVGLLMYGVYPEERFRQILPLSCALRGFARIVFVKQVPAKTKLSYGATYQTTKSCRIATVSLGYADGFPRALSSKFSMRWKKKKAGVVGTICMDQTLLDVSGLAVRPGDAVCFLRKGSVEEMARLVPTVSQEILCGFASPRLEKIYRE